MCSAAVSNVSKDSFILKYCHDKYKTQTIHDIVVDYFLPALRFVPH